LDDQLDQGGIERPDFIELVNVNVNGLRLVHGLVPLIQLKDPLASVIRSSGAHVLQLLAQDLDSIAVPFDVLRGEVVGDVQEIYL
jgi:hypothetical protein